MGRTRTKSKNQRHVPPRPPFTTQSANAHPSTTPSSVPALISKAQSIIEQCDYDLANQLLQRILQRSPKNVEAREMLGVVQLETGSVQEARKVRSIAKFHLRLISHLPNPSCVQTFESLILPHPDAPSTPAYTPYLHLAQLSDEDPHLALRYYQSALDILTAQIKGKERATESSSDSYPDADVKGTVVRVLISMVEIWMDPSYDLWYGSAISETMRWISCVSHPRSW